jgi:hypothetical protein
MFDEKEYVTNLPLENGGTMRLISRPKFKKWSIYYFDVSGERHNEHGPSIINSSGTKIWFIHGKIHREDGPALMASLGEIWYYQGMIHRLNGPAENSREINELCYYIYDKQYTKKHYNKIMFWINTACNIFLKKLRNKYTQKLEETNICNEKGLYKIISSYII